ncbi:MAG: hypothetical protein EXS08_13305 [Planctomycetes bacterium]|nr:hypothetical protein [Planctomycetota bacterium]
MLPERGVLRGQVVDPDGAPVANAFVYFGGQARARGDEPFKPFRPGRILDGARSGADGWFELRGEGCEVTAGHERFSSVTLDAVRASRIVLGARGALRGRLVDASGRALADRLLRLDQRKDGPPSTTDAAGRFAFERLEAGAHAVWLEGQVLVGVRLEAGEERELDLTVPALGTLELLLPPGATLAPDEVRGVLVGREDVFGFYHEFAPGSAPDMLLVPHSVLPGRYWLASSQGVVAPLTLAPGATRIEFELGGAVLRVRSTQRVNIQVVPADADPFLRLAAARGYVKVVRETEGRFRVSPGRYALVGEAGVLLREVDVPVEGLELE